MREVLLVLNAGSSSLRFALFAAAGGDAPPLWEGLFEALGTAQAALREAAGHGAVGLPGAGHARCLQWLLQALQGHPDWQLQAAGHRVVHGGTHFAAPVRVDAAVRAALEALVPLAPLHQPHALAALDALAALHPQLPQVACFDTAFHRAQDPLARSYALPQALSAQGIERYGFHGLSCESLCAQLRAVAGAAVADGRVVLAHLGAGASMTAVLGGRSVATTMGFTPLDGLPMATRCGNLDPGVVLHLLALGHDATAITDLLYRRSGLLGVSGLSGDLRVLQASTNPAAARALDLLAYRAMRELGSLAAALGGLDALVFSGGMGEHAPQLRARIAQGAGWLGARLDAQANARGQACISTPGSAVSLWVIPTDEDRVIAAHTRAVLGLGQATA